MARNMKLQGLDKIFSTEEMRQDDKRERVMELSPEELRPFQNHPFQVREDAELQKLVESVREYGVLTPLIARPAEDGYELISGHRRKLAAELAGLSKLPVLIRDMTDDESIVLMVDSNIRRENLLPRQHRNRAFVERFRHSPDF